MTQPQSNKPNNRSIRPVHRIIGSIIMLFTLYFGTTGLLIQSVDLRAIASHAAATDPEMMAIRESLTGTQNFTVLQPTDYAAPALPDGFDFNTGLANVLMAVRQGSDAGVPLRYVEMRMVDGKPIALVQTGIAQNGGGQGGNGQGGNGQRGNGQGGNGQGGNSQAGNGIVRFDPLTGAHIPNPPPVPRTRPAQSMHAKFKAWHRFGVLSDKWEFINALIGIGLFCMIVTGLVLYFQLLRTRSGAGLKGMFWNSGGWWRSLHRWVSIVAAVFLMVVSISGALLSIDTVALGVYGMTHTNAGRYSRFPYGMIADLSSPLPDAQLPGMLNTTLAAYHAVNGNTPIKVIRLRYFAGMPQGLIISGSGDDTREVVYNAVTGQRASMTEPSYPYQGFPFGWEEHELMKQIHRGDIFGVPGRLMDVFAGLSLVFLSLSGLIMYVDLWRRRSRAGRKSIFWT